MPDYLKLFYTYDPVCSSDFTGVLGAQPLGDGKGNPIGLQPVLPICHRWYYGSVSYRHLLHPVNKFYLVGVPKYLNDLGPSECN